MSRLLRRVLFALRRWRREREGRRAWLRAFKAYASYCPYPGADDSDVREAIERLRALGYRNNGSETKR